MLQDIAGKLKALSSEASDRNWKINDMTECVKSLQEDYIGLKQRVELLKKASKYGESPDDDTCIEHASESQQSLSDMQSCVDQVKERMEEAEGFVHPCGGQDWRPVALLNMDDPQDVCPSEWSLSVLVGQRVCTGSTPATFSVDDSYTEVCGQIRGYGAGVVGAFGPVLGSASPVVTLADHIPLARGAVVSTTTEHIWTFAAGGRPPDNFASASPDDTLCPCLIDEDDFFVAFGNLPDIVGSDYFCESRPTPASSGMTSAVEVPLWDGLNCESGSRCCRYGAPPIFRKVLSASTNDPILISTTVHIFYIELYVR